ncbi:hypothetical protein VOLCADRAFT_117703 [Volvox carteri f. nagariensis]|uniref:Uncharacterized protein n=1 Tax=Volvox carteri f. nagariensis TaxID=3068 RepID=D8TWV8_VOLCA|nr:uncharacterized protein VOLCADRAFT_117703 [Volvox carteri f. nagariensis]EFJ48218.1 hypothetical protein VOLCADRAFT_117703 [Volvox carteri f. nagariensis]|eukprot:XP_002950903.1 hypothetical protein VOLCADRAFT_117703 [Volvox carteri f. nagariensis]
MVTAPVPSKLTARLGCPPKRTLITGNHSQARNRAKTAVKTIIRSSEADEPKGKCVAGGDGGLSGIFNQFISLKGIKSPAAAVQQLNPSPLLPPTAALEQAMTMLQCNDWPEPDSGVQAAFNFTIPAAEGPEAGAVRSWMAGEEWLSWPRFHAMLHVSYNPLINCDQWRVVSPLVFPSERYDNKAVQAVEVRSRPRQPWQPEAERSNCSRTGSGTETRSTSSALRSYTYTFCWERVESGAFKDCWLISGVRVGNYAL